MAGISISERFILYVHLLQFFMWIVDTVFITNNLIGDCYFPYNKFLQDHYDLYPKYQTQICVFY
ncbi:hypothetical protein pb186bvf_010452 [Paramecium bursaria]